MFDIKLIDKRYQKSLEERRLWEDLWQEIATYVLPRKSNINIERFPGQKQTKDIFDSTAPNALELLGASVYGSMTPSSVRWFSLKMRQKQQNEVDDIREWLEEAQDMMLLAYRQSSFNLAVNEFLIDVAGFGTGAMLVEERKGPASFNGFQFTTLAPGKYSIAEGNDGSVDTLWREFKLPLRLIMKREWKLSPDMMAAKKDNKIDAEYEIIHVVLPREDFDSRKVDSENMPYASIYYDKKQKVLLNESGFREMPALVARWAKTSGETYGRGRGHIALPDIKTLNKAKELELGAWAKMVDPPLYVLDDGVVGNVDTRPGELTVVRDLNAIREQTFNPRFDLTNLKASELKDSIRKSFFSDLIILRDGPQMTATEVLQRTQEVQRLLGPTYGRFEHEFLNPFIERTFSLMFYAGALPPLPEALEQLLAEGDANIDIEYEGPLAMAQRSQDTQAIQQLIALGNALAQATGDSGALDILKVDSAMRESGHVWGARSSVLRSEEELAQFKAAKQQAAQAAAEATEKRENAKALGTMTPAIKEMNEQEQSAMPPIDPEDPENEASFDEDPDEVAA